MGVRDLERRKVRVLILPDPETGETVVDDLLQEEGNTHWAGDFAVPFPPYPAIQLASDVCRNDVQITMDRLPCSRDKSTAKLSLPHYPFRPLSGSRWEAMTNVRGGSWKKVGKAARTQPDAAFALGT
jgi:hypothetical protein